MKIKIDINSSSDVPIFQQIVDGFELLIITQALNEDDFLPSVRDFASAHTVNPNTVSKAYQLLQTMELVDGVRGLGLKVKKVKDTLLIKRKTEILNSKIEDLLMLSAQLGMGFEELMGLLKKNQRGKK